MFNLETIWKNIKLIGIILIIIAAVWFYKEYEFQKQENKRQTENSAQLRKSDSLRFTSQILTQDEIKDYLVYNNQELKKKLEKDGIKLNRIESIVSSNYRYQDSSSKETDISGIVESIKNSIPKSQNWIDSTQCLIVKGSVNFDGQKLKVTVNDRTFQNKSDGVAYWQRREWNFIGIKTRFLGKKEFTAVQFDECGESKVLKIEKKK